MQREKGSALIIVILVVLVLTMVGLAATVYMGVEDRISSNDQLLKEALNASEVGLRKGESVIGVQFNAGTSLTAMLNLASTSSTAAVTPNVPVVPTGAPPYDLAHLGTYLQDTGAVQLANQPVSYDNGATSVTNRAYYSLYVRNNPDDITGTPTTDQDGKIDLISVGWVQNSNGVPVAVKITSEEFSLGSSFAVGAQADWNSGGTNAM